MVVECIWWWSAYGGVKVVGRSFKIVSTRNHGDDVGDNIGGDVGDNVLVGEEQVDRVDDFELGEEDVKLVVAFNVGGGDVGDNLGDNVGGDDLGVVVVHLEV